MVPLRRGESSLGRKRRQNRPRPRFPREEKSVRHEEPALAGDDNLRLLQNLQMSRGGGNGDFEVGGYVTYSHRMFTFQRRENTQSIPVCQALKLPFEVLEIHHCHST